MNRRMIASGIVILAVVGAALPGCRDQATDPRQHGKPRA